MYRNTLYSTHNTYERYDYRSKNTILIAMKYLLTSSGCTNDTIAKKLSDMAEKPISEISVLFVPTAANTEGGDKRWLIGNLQDFDHYNVKSIDILDIAAVSDDVWKKRFLEKDVICFGGGNEKYLAEIFQKLNMKVFLAEMPPTKVYMGISAGSMVVGHFMPEKLYPILFPEENFGPATTPATGMFDICFIPHLNSDYFSHLREEALNKVRNDFTKPVFAPDDQTALCIQGGSIEVFGDGVCWKAN